MKGGKKTNSKLEKLKNDLEQAINNPDSTMEDLEKISCNIDKEIEKIYKQKNDNDKEDLEKLLNTEQSGIILKIKSDLLNHYYNISPLELELISQNIYDYCCLMANDIPTQEIMSYITEKNAKYYDRLSEKSREKMTVEFNLKFYKYLASKYTEILKNNK